MTKKIISLVLVFLMLTSTVFAQQTSEPSNWAKLSVDKAKELGITTEATTENYTQATTREEFAALVVVLSEKVLGRELEAPETSPFTDSSDDYVEKAYQAGIVKGIGGGKFAPNEKVTREQIVVMFVNAMNMLENELGTELIDENLTWSFDDEDTFSFWAADSIKVAGANGLVKGVGNNTFNPRGYATKEQSLVLSLRSFYFTKDLDEVIQKSEEYYKNVKSVEMKSETYANFTIVEQGIPMDMEMTMVLDSKQLFDPYKAKLALNAEIYLSMLGEELVFPIVADEYMVQEGDQLVSYYVSEDPETGEMIYDKYVLPLGEDDLEELSNLAELTSFDVFNDYRLVDEEIIDGKTIYTVAMSLSMNEESIALIEETIGDLWAEIGLDTDLLYQLDVIEYIYRFDAETGAILTIEADLSDYFKTVLNELLIYEDINGEELTIEISDFLLKMELVSINEIDDIIIPQEVIDNAVEFELE